MTYVGVRYRFGGTTRETGLDCSGLMLNVFQHAGVDLPRRATDMARLGIKVDKNDLQPGDLVFLGKRIKWLILPLHESETDRHLIGLSG
ncbi:hypothetical protein GPA21_20150 [Azoarcus taiwanensis]|uniref:NlpC/P60 domain-containing protein n=2 Tax=Azoarcus taiwanensis TaxID=666964 RepID=A0A972FGR4_9RHOO|nr:hypothetical protein [Azoarcus taiwanensis]